MKEVTYEEWQKNPTPRMMWVWNDDEDVAEQEKVVFIKSGGTEPVIAITSGDLYIILFKHCAEIEKQRRMTNKELSRWAGEKLTREWKYKDGNYVYCCCGYEENHENEEVPDDVLIREDDGEWREPLVEVAKNRELTDEEKAIVYTDNIHIEYNEILSRPEVIDEIRKAYIAGCEETRKIMSEK